MIERILLRHNRRTGPRQIGVTQLQLCFTEPDRRVRRQPALHRPLGAADARRSMAAAGGLR